jgi:hypothetical protein
MPTLNGETALTVPEGQVWLSGKSMDWISPEVIAELKTSQFSTSQYDVYELDFGPLTSACKFKADSRKYQGPVSLSFNSGFLYISISLY